MSNKYPDWNDNKLPAVYVGIHHFACIQCQTQTFQSHMAKMQRWKADQPLKKKKLSLCSCYK